MAHEVGAAAVNGQPTWITIACDNRFARRSGVERTPLDRTVPIICKKNPALIVKGPCSHLVAQAQIAGQVFRARASADKLGILNEAP